MEPTSRDLRDENYEKPNLKGDRLNFALLTFLYVLQCSAGGVAFATPNILQKRNATYENQGAFNFIWYPFAFKILWAPIVDSIYIKKIGRRKSWLIGTQYITGALFLLLSVNVDNWLGTEDGRRKPNIHILTAIFFSCNLSNSIQDIALDAWSLTLFQSYPTGANNYLEDFKINEKIAQCQDTIGVVSRKNVAYAAISQSVGFSFGMYIVSAVFIMLESKDFSNRLRSVPQDYGLVSFPEFSFFLSILYIISSTLLLIFKKEKIHRSDDFTKELVDDENNELTIKGTYTLLWKMLKIRPIQILAILGLTRSIGAAPVRTVVPLKLLDNGITKDTLATFNLLLFPLQISIPFVLKRFITGRRPLRTFLLFYILRVMNSCVYTSFIFLISYWKNKYNVLPTWYYWPLLLIHTFDHVGSYLIMMTLTATLTRISDPRFGGVYMTFFNAMYNVGEFWPSSLCLWLVNLLNIRDCSRIDKMKDGSCYILIDGLYVEIIVFTAAGLLWVYWAKKMADYVEETDPSAFKVRQSPVTGEISPLEERSLPLMNKQ